MPVSPTMAIQWPALTSDDDIDEYTLPSMNLYSSDSDDDASDLAEIELKNPSSSTMPLSITSALTVEQIESMAKRVKLISSGVTATTATLIKSPALLLSNRKRNEPSTSSDYFGFGNGTTTTKRTFQLDMDEIYQEEEKSPVKQLKFEDNSLCNNGGTSSCSGGSTVSMPIPSIVVSSPECSLSNIGAFDRLLPRRSIVSTTFTKKIVFTSKESVMQPPKSMLRRPSGSVASTVFDKRPLVAGRIPGPSMSTRPGATTVGAVARKPPKVLSGARFGFNSAVSNGVKKRTQTRDNGSKFKTPPKSNVVVKRINEDISKTYSVKRNKQVLRSSNVRQSMCVKSLDRYHV